MSDANPLFTHRILNRRLAMVSLCLTIASSTSLPSKAGDEFEQPPISYHDAVSHDPVAKLWQRIQAGEIEIKPNSRGAYIESLLTALDVPVSSQCLVFSKTSLQINHISPRTPRAIYFNDSVYVGYVQGSNIMELTAVDPQLGCVFYTFELPSEESSGEGSKHPTIIRDRGQCLSCHATTRTERVPGVLVRSIYPDKAGRPRSGASSYVTDHRSPFLQRWGGWYVTGSHGDMRHLGNIFAVDRQDPQSVDSEDGANWAQMPKQIDMKPYPLPTSDIVSLMVMEHQTRVHNLITRANYETRQATYLDQAMNKALDRAPDFVSESTQRRIATVGDELVRGLLFADEFELSSPVVGSSRFREEFAARGPKDSRGRSLYELDLNKRLFRYPCSYLLLSEHFAGLPKPVMDYVRVQLGQILRGERNAPSGVMLDDIQKQAIYEIVSELKPGWL